MKKSYDDVKSLLSDLKSDIDSTLASEVLDEVRKCEIEHVQEDVLGVYNPCFYERRRNGGIDDPENIVGMVNNLTLSVTNVTPFNSGYGTKNHGVGLATLINGGDGAGGFEYDYPYRIRVSYTNARPFLDNTVRELEESNRLENALNKGLKSRGAN